MQPTQSGAKPAPPGGEPGVEIARNAPTTRDLLIRFGFLAFIDAIAIFFAYSLIANGQAAAAVILLIVTALINYLFLDDRLYPIRWLAPGLVMMLLMVIYPLVYTLYIGLTNYSDGHILSKEQVISQLESQYFQPENAVTYQWTAYCAGCPDNPQFKLVLKDPSGKFFVAENGQEVQPLDVAEPPESLPDGYQRINTIQAVQYLTRLQNFQATQGDQLIRVTGVGTAPAQQRRYRYDAAADTMVDNRTGTVYRSVDGNFTADDGQSLQPGFTTVVGFENYARVFTDRNIQGPFFGVFIWTIIFAISSVLLSFAVGLGLAIVFNDKDLPLKPLFRSIAILPYTIPGFISVLIWVGLMNPIYGPFNQLLRNVIGFSPDWFSNGTWTKVGILFVNTWLGFPYMMLLCLGALQAIPTDMYEAADLDGASPVQQFWKLTLPMLLISIGPLLIGSFAFNFNNFAVIELFNAGGPPIAGANTPAGQSDILISYTYRLAFAGGRGADFGLASAIAVFIFLIVASITAFNFRYTKQLEEVR